jgi:transposase InsO family protein
LCLAIAAGGKPKVLRTDNEACFCSRRFRWGLRLLGIRHQRSDLGCPWQNGRVERFFLTLKQKLDAWEVSDADMLGRALGDFSFWYNCVRPHQHLDGKTPMEAWWGIDPYARVPKRSEWFSAWDGLLTGEWHDWG